MNARLSSFFLRASALAVVAAVLGGCGNSGPKPAIEAQPVVVRVCDVRFSDAAVPIRVAGLLSRKSEADLAFKIGGVVEQVHVRAGDRVQRGQLLAHLRLDEIDAQLAQAKAAEAKAQRDLERIERLHAGAVATLENAQDARTALELATAQVRIAEFNRQYARIIAPADGHILLRNVEPNELVPPGRPMLRFATEDDGWLVSAGLPDVDAARISAGVAATVQLETGGHPVVGRITHIAAAADSVTRTTPVEITLETAPAHASSGRVVLVTLHPPSVSPRPVVPASAFLEGTGADASVFVVDARPSDNPGRGVARRQRVRIEALDRDLGYLETPLPFGAAIIIGGAEYLRDGQPVVIAKE